MTRIAVLADIHANLPALEAVVDDIARTGVDEVLVGGDLVGRGPQGRKEGAAAEQLKATSIRGNHEDYLLQFRRRDVPDDWLVADIWAASRWMAEQIGEWHADFIDQLPLSRSAESTDGLRLVHGSPTSYQEGIGDWTSDETIEEHIDSIEESLLVCAHTHRPLDRQVLNGRVVNVGSVGLPFNGDPRAQYAIFEPQGEAWSVDFRQVDYDRTDLLQTYQESGFLAEGGLTASILRMEVETARPFLVPFLKWTEIEEIEPTAGRFESFLEVYEPEMAMKDVFERFGEPDSE